MIRSSSVHRFAARRVPVRRGHRLVPAAGVVLAAVLLSACGAQSPHPGAAAVVGRDRITEAAVEARVAEFRAQAAELPSGQYQEQAGLVGATVSGMVFGDVVDYALAQHQLSVSDTEVAQLRADQAQAWGGETGLEQMLLLKHAVPAGRSTASTASRSACRSWWPRAGSNWAPPTATRRSISCWPRRRAS